MRLYHRAYAAHPSAGQLCDQITKGPVSAHAWVVFQKQPGLRLAITAVAHQSALKWQIAPGRAACREVRVTPALHQNSAFWILTLGTVCEQAEDFCGISA